VPEDIGAMARANETVGRKNASTGASKLESAAERRRWGRSVSVQAVWQLA